MSVADPSGRSQALPDIIPGILTAGSVNLFSGSSNVGKTCFTAGMLAQIQRGEPVLERICYPPPAIGYLCIDRGWRTAAHWLTLAGVTNLAFYSLADDLSFSPSRLRNKAALVGILGELFDKLNLPPGALVVVDPIAIFLGGNLNDYQNCAIAMIEIRRVVMKRGLTVIGLAHNAKLKNDKREQYTRLQDRILGSAAQHGYGDTQMTLAGPAETGEKYYTFLWHSHRTQPELFELGRNKEGLFVPWEQGMEVMEVDDEKLLEVISDAPEGSTLGEIILASGESRSTIHRRIQRLMERGRVEKVGYGRYRRKPVN